MRLAVGQATRKAIDEHELPDVPIESDTARDIAFLLVAAGEEKGLTPPPLLLAFLAEGAIEVVGLRNELCALAVALGLDAEGWVPVNALIRHIEWCDDREGGAGWRFV